MDTTTIKLGVWSTANQWLMKRKQVHLLSVHVDRVGSKKCYFIPTAANVKLAQTQLLAYIDVHTECNWTTFDDFVEFETSVYRLYMNEVDWRQSRCNCPFFHKNCCFYHFYLMKIVQAAEHRRHEELCYS